MTAKRYPLIVAMILTLAFVFIHSNTGPAKANDDARQTITNQLEAFLSGDFEQAYSFASDDIKQIFPTLDRFMAMVKGGYLPVLSPGNYAFGNSAAPMDGRFVQEILIRAPDGSDWTAVYYMEQQPDGSWRVDGVNLKKGAAGMT